MKVERERERMEIRNKGMQHNQSIRRGREEDGKRKRLRQHNLKPFHRDMVQPMTYFRKAIGWRSSDPHLQLLCEMVCDNGREGGEERG